MATVPHTDLTDAEFDLMLALAVPAPGPIVTEPGTDQHSGYNNLRRRGFVELVDGAWRATPAGVAAATGHGGEP